MGTIRPEWWAARSGDEVPMEARMAKLEAVTESIDKRLTSVESDVREIRRDMRADFRLTWGGMIFIALGLAGLMAKGFGWL